MRTKPKLPQQPTKIISHCTFTVGSVKIDADTLATVSAIAEAARQNALALTEAARAVQKAAQSAQASGPMISL